MNRKHDDKRFYRVMTTLSEVFDKGTKPSAIKVEIYFKALEVFTIDDIEKASIFLVRERIYPSLPMPADIIEAIQGGAPLKAWLKFEKALRQIGSQRSVCFDDPVIHSVVDGMGGWPATADWTEKDMTWKQKEFERLYQICSQRKAHPDYLVGSIEIDNHSRGFKGFIPPPVGVRELESGEIKFIPLPLRQIEDKTPLMLLDGRGGAHE